MKPLEAFNVMRRGSDGRQPRCRDCAKAWYAANSAAHRANVRVRAIAWRAEMQRNLAAYLAEHHCVDCGESDIRVLDFDHNPGTDKKAEIAKLVNQGVGWARVQAEIAKCRVRCANCHRRKTFERAGWWRQRVFEDVSAAADQGTLARLQNIFGLEPEPDEA